MVLLNYDYFCPSYMLIYPTLTYLVLLNHDKYYNHMHLAILVRYIQWPCSHNQKQPKTKTKFILDSIEQIFCKYYINLKLQN